MIQGLPKPGAGALSQSGPHDEFLELCAASTSGELTDDEQKRLKEHLAICASCREALRQYESIVSDVIPAIAAGEVDDHGQVHEALAAARPRAAFHRNGVVENLTVLTHDMDDACARRDVRDT